MRSDLIKGGNKQAAARAMWRAVGLTDDDFKKPLIGVAHSWIEIMPCTMHLREIAEWVIGTGRLLGGLAIVTTFFALRIVSGFSDLSVFALNFVTGMGLGLSFVTSILEHHGVPLEIESEPLCGATFRVSFRLADAEAPAGA